MELQHRSGGEKGYPVIGLLYLCFFGVETFIFSFNEIFFTIGGLVFKLHRIAYMLGILCLIPGILLSPVMFVIFLVQIIRRRKNRRYLKNSVFTIAGCVLIVLAGMLMKQWAAPPASAFIMECKMNHYERVAKEIHQGKRKHAGISGGEPGHEDVAFYQHTFSGEEEDYLYEGNTSYVTSDTYILYSEDDVCNIELPKHEPSGYLNIKLTPIKPNWYEMTADSVWNP